MERDKWRPGTRETADHSLPYITAAALMDGDITLKQFDREHLRNKALLDLVDKVECREKKEYTDLYGTSYPNKITVNMDNGEVFVKEIVNPKGHPLDPLDRNQVESKFRINAESLLDSAQQDRLIRYVWDLDNLKNLKPLMDCLVIR